jgi:hypothetical protein
MTQPKKATPVNLSTNKARRSLPFITAPKETFVLIGNEDTGVFKIKVLGGLTNGEALELQRLVREKEFVKAAQEFKDASEEELIELVKQQMMITQLAGFILDYASEIATIVLVSRVDDEWTLEDTKALPAALVNEISAFMQQEINAAGKDRTVQQQQEEAKGEEEPKKE